MLGLILEKLLGKAECEGRHRGVCSLDERELTICGTNRSDCPYSVALESPVRYLVDGDRTPIGERKGVAVFSCSYSK